MKMTDKFLSTIVLTAALCASCSTDELAEQQQEQTEAKTVSLTATLNEVQTRAGMSKGTDNKTASFHWHKSDLILVQIVVSGGTISNAQFDTATGTETGVTSATFKGLVRDNEQMGTYAVYPYNEKHTFTSATALTYNLPASYTYTTVDNGIFSKTTTYRTNSTNIPMYGKIDDGSVAFQYLGGVAVIRINEMPYTSGTLTVTADQKLSGDFSVDLSAETPEMAIATTDEEAEKSVTFTFEGAAEGGVGVFYLPMATGSYSNVKVALSDGNTNTNTSTIDYGQLNVAKGSVTAVPLYNNWGTLEKVEKYTHSVIEINGHNFVDLGLPSGLLWAEANVGAESAADDGNYYAWGETEPKESYQWSGYDYSNSTNDVATVKWESPCRMPTTDNFDELLNSGNCTWKWTCKTTSSNTSINGWKITSTQNGNSIFLPASGWYYEKELKDYGTGCYYWTTTRYTDYGSNYAYYLSSSFMTYYYRWVGRPVRPVAAKPTTLE